VTFLSRLFCNREMLSTFIAMPLRRSNMATELEVSDITGFWAVLMLSIYWMRSFRTGKFIYLGMTVIYQNQLSRN
jgi:hypothetical protein